MLINATYNFNIEVDIPEEKLRKLDDTNRDCAIHSLICDYQALFGQAVDELERAGAELKLSDCYAEDNMNDIVYTLYGENFYKKYPEALEDLTRR